MIDHLNGFDSLLCLSHLRWDFVFQRPQHLMMRFANKIPVYFFEEPVFIDQPSYLDVSERSHNLFVLVPHISHHGRDAEKTTDLQRVMLDNFIAENGLSNILLWYYSPMAIEFAGNLKVKTTVFDCMDELSAFKFAPPELIENEKRVLEKADVVFTGGHSLYEAKRERHHSVFPIPSSIDVPHFAQARSKTEEPVDQVDIPHPRLGFCGVIDERFDTKLLAEMAVLRPDWHFVMIGPVVKISEDELPRASNIHYLGGKKYEELPTYFASWDIALMPFAINEATRYISPTKTPEYLAAGKPVISTPIRDVVRPYGENDLVKIGSTAREFVQYAEEMLKNEGQDRLVRVDEFLSQISWYKTWEEMARLIAGAEPKGARTKERAKEQAA